MPVKPCSVNFSGFKVAPSRKAVLTMELAGEQLADGGIGKEGIWKCNNAAWRQHDDTSLLRSNKYKSWHPPPSVGGCHGLLQLCQGWRPVLGENVVAYRPAIQGTYLGAVADGVLGLAEVAYAI